jgi:hypothetical protein
MKGPIGRPLDAARRPRILPAGARARSRFRGHDLPQNGGVRYAPVLVIACSLFAAYKLFAGRPVQWHPGVLVAADPVQKDIENAELVRFKGLEMTPRARFSAEVRVLGSERYRLGELADAVPLDLAVGWGPMSDSAVLRNIDVSQANRFYFWHYDNEPPIPREDIESHSANWHVLPANASIWKTLSGLRVGDVVTLDGELVDLKGPNFTIKTSLTRKDTGAGACEVFYVESASLR